MTIFKGLVSIALFTLTTLFWGIPLIALTFLKVVIPVKRF